MWSRCIASGIFLCYFVNTVMSDSILDTLTAGISNLLPLNEKQDVAYSGKSIHPVLLLPGYMGSQLQVTLDRENTVSTICTKKSETPSTLWLSLFNHQPLQEDCWLENIMLHYDEMTGKSSSDTGVNVTVKAFASTEAIEFITPPPQETSQTMYFYNLIRALEANGYTKDKSIRGAPYDWRKSPYENDAFFTSLKKLIEDTYYANNERAVIILCHSMGCTFSRIFVNSQPQQWLSRYIKSWIVIGAPLGGTFRYMYLYFADDDPPLANLFHKIRIAERTFTSVPFLLPRPSVFRDQVFVQTSNRNFTANDYDDFFQAIKMSPPLDVWLRVSSAEQSADTTTSPSVPFDIHCIGGTGQRTLSSAMIDGDLQPQVKWRPLYSDGDEYVLTKSMRECIKLANMTSGSFTFKEFTLNHMQLIQHRSSIDHILDIVNGINGKRIKL